MRRPADFRSHTDRNGDDNARLWRSNGIARSIGICVPKVIGARVARVTRQLNRWSVASRLQQRVQVLTDKARVVVTGEEGRVGQDTTQERDVGLDPFNTQLS